MKSLPLPLQHTSFQEEFFLEWYTYTPPIIHRVCPRLKTTMINTVDLYGYAIYCFQLEFDEYKYSRTSLEKIAAHSFETFNSFFYIVFSSFFIIFFSFFNTTYTYLAFKRYHGWLFFFHFVLRTKIYMYFWKNFIKINFIFNRIIYI